MKAKHEPSTQRKTLGDSLLELDGCTTISTTEGQELAKRIMHRDRWRIRLLIAATIAFFALTVIGIFGSFYIFYLKIVPWMDHVMSEMDRHNPANAIEHAAAAGYQGLYASQMLGFWAVFASLATLLAAAICTVLLIFATRRATLRQIQTGLHLLSEQVERLQHSYQAGHVSATGQPPQESST
jgi:hypothetical protein